MLTRVFVHMHGPAGKHVRDQGFRDKERPGLGGFSGLSCKATPHAWYQFLLKGPGFEFGVSSRVWGVLGFLGGLGFLGFRVLGFRGSGSVGSSAKALGRVSARMQRPREPNTPQLRNRP